MSTDEPDGRSYKRSWTGLHVPGDYAGKSSEPAIGPLRPEEYEIQLRGLADFAAHPELRCIWQFDPNEGELLGGSFQPGVNRLPDTDYLIVNGFAPGNLVIHSPEVLRGGRYRFAITHGVLFDSNIYNRIIQFVNQPERMAPAEYQGTKRLLEAVIARGYDHQMMPYVLECLCNNPAEEGWRFAFSVMKAILRLHMMNREAFRASGAIEIDAELLSVYRERFRTTDFDEIVEAQLAPYAEVREPFQVKLFLVALLAMVGIRRFTHAMKAIRHQFAAFDDFVFGRLGFVSSEIRNLALFYFGGRLDKWIRVQQNSRGSKALELLTNSAWDLALGRLPRQLLAESPEEQPSISYFCTLEAELASYLGTSLTAILRVRKNGGFASIDHYDEALIFEAAGPDAEKVLMEADRRASDFLKLRSEGNVNRIDNSNIEDLLAEVTESFLERFAIA
jgi:hypothetical protein